MQIFHFSATLTDIRDQIKSDKNPAGKIFDLTSGFVFDGLTGRAAGEAAGPAAANAVSK